MVRIITSGLLDSRIDIQVKMAVTVKERID